MTETWLSTVDSNVVLIRLSTQDDVTIDRLGELRFGQPAGDGVELRDGVPYLADPAASPPRRVVGIPPGFEAWCGWYGGGLLLTQIPEADLGEPVVLVGDGDALVRAYPVDTTTLVRADGVEIVLGTGTDGRRELRCSRGRGPVTVVSTSDSYAERPVEFVAAGTTLRGTLITPATPGPHPAAVAVHPAAGGQRDYMRIFVTALLEAGVAALIYDKQGTGVSGGTQRPTIFEQATAASAALDLLAGQPDIDPTRLGLAGFSNGMWAVPMVAAQHPGVSFVAGIGAPGVSMVDSEMHRRGTVLRAAGIGESAVAAAQRAWRCLFAIHAEGSTDPVAVARQTEELRAALAEAAGSAELAAYDVPGYARLDPMLSPVPPQLPAEELMVMPAGPGDASSLYDPVTDYRRIGCPLFLQYGEYDTGVPTAVSVRAIEAAVPGANLTVRVYPGLDHALNVAPAGVVGLSAEEAMFLYHGFRFGPGVWADLTAWLTTVTA